MEDEVKKLEMRLIVFTVIMTLILIGAVWISFYVLDNLILGVGLVFGLAMVEVRVAGKMVKRIKELKGEE